MGVTSTATADDGLRDFRCVYRAHYGFVWHALHRFGTSPTLLDDAVQDVFVVAYRRRADYRGPSAKPWLYGIARRVASNYRRSTRRRRQRDQALVHATRPTVADGTREAIEVLDRYLAGLDPVDRELLVLSELEGMTGRELADATGRNMQTIYARLRRLKLELREHLGELERVREQRPRPTAQSWAALVPALSGASIPALGVGAGATSATWGWVLGMLGAGALMFAIAGPLHDDPPDPAPEPAPSAVASEIAVAAPADPARPDPVPTHAPHEPAPVTVALPHPDLPVAPELPTAPHDAERRPRPRARPPAATPEDPAPEGLAAETELLRRGALALEAGDAAAALRVAQEHARRFPDSALFDLRAAVRVEALCGLGRSSQAQREASAFVRAYPASPVVERITGACGSTIKKRTDPDKTGA